MTLPEKLIYLRKLSGKDQMQTAALIGITPKFYDQLEREIRVPGKIALQRIADYYRISADCLTNPAATENDLKINIRKAQPEPMEQPKTSTPPAVKKPIFRTSDGYVCTAQHCGWRERVDEDTYFCMFPGNGCIKERSESIGK